MPVLADGDDLLGVVDALVAPWTEVTAAAPHGSRVSLVVSDRSDSRRIFAKIPSKSANQGLSRSLSRATTTTTLPPRLSLHTTSHRRRQIPALHI